jgi:hypothetical protein
MFMQNVSGDINKLVSLTFDEDPEVRKKAARSLGELDDPATVFALVELSYDKDPSVREVAQKTLDKKRKTEPELMSFADIFSSGAKKKEEEELPADAKEKVLRPISRIFEKRLGKEKAEAVKKKMMPTIEKIYLKSRQQSGSKKKSEESGRKAMQEFLTSYLEVISDIEEIGDESAQPLGTDERPRLEVEEELSKELELVGKQPAQLDRISSEIASIELEHIEELKEQQEMEVLPDTFFKKAYEVMMLSGGDDGVMKKEMNRMLQDAKREITLAFKLAKKKFKETKITNITKIKDKMRNINTEVLGVKLVENMEYQKSKRVKATVTRVLVNDESGNEGILYLFDDRGVAIREGMRVKVVGGVAKTFKFSGETALTLGRKGNVYIVL